MRYRQPCIAASALALFSAQLGCGDEPDAPKLRDLSAERRQQLCAELEPIMDELSLEVLRASCVFNALQSPGCPVQRARCDDTMASELEGDLVTVDTPGLPAVPVVSCDPSPADVAAGENCEATGDDVKACYRGLARAARELVDTLHCSSDLSDGLASTPASACEKVGEGCLELIGLKASAEVP